MDTTFTKQGICFTWDQNKAISDQQKHGLSFEQATQAFFDPFLVVTEASKL